LINRLVDFDAEDVFGKRKNTNHSPKIRAQMDLDSYLLWMVAFSSVAMLLFEFKYIDEYINLRMNHINSEMGRFEMQDFI
jgi:hypothetical protein